MKLIMQKIKHLKQLKTEQKKLLLRQDELEEAIRGDWKELKASLQPSKLAWAFFSKWFARSRN